MNECAASIRRGLSRVAAAFVLGAALSLAMPAAAQPEQGVPWSSLSPQQQQLLRPFADRWNQLPPQRQGRLAQGATHWIGMTP